MKSIEDKNSAKRKLGESDIEPLIRHKWPRSLDSLHKDKKLSKMHGVPLKGKGNRVRFTTDKPTTIYFEPYQDNALKAVDPSDANSTEHTSRLTEELTILSTTHGRARRELRDISKHDLQTVMKYGEKKRARTVNGEKRWMFRFGNIVYITDWTCTREITSYKDAIDIQPAPITQKIKDEHKDTCQTLRDNFHLMTTHSVIIIDQSGSMRASDVNGFRSRSEAAYGTLALDYIAEQLYQRRGDERLIDAVTVIEMNDDGSIFCFREPLDWILFNKLLFKQKQAKPRSHGNYLKSLDIAKSLIHSEVIKLQESGLEDGDLPAYMLVFLSDGKPSDNTVDEKLQHLFVIEDLCLKLKDKLKVFGMGIGAIGSEFDHLKSLVSRAQSCCAVESEFVHAGLSSTAIGDAFSSLATSTTATRTQLLATENDTSTRPEKQFKMREKNSESGVCSSKRFTDGVKRYHYDPTRPYPWRLGGFRNCNTSGFEVEENPFGKGAERLAYRFYEVANENGTWKRVGGFMVAKESNKITPDNETRKEKFHEHFCRVQLKAQELATKFNEVVRSTPVLFQSEDEVSRPPPIMFLKCYVYEYQKNGVSCGYLVENYLKGKYIKYNGNVGYVRNVNSDSTIDLKIGEVCLTDFLHAFSHWVYVFTHNKMIVCDLQGVLDEEGRYPVFRLTDPAINSKNRKHHRYGRTDAGMKGIRLFCSTHKCNKVCKGLGLPPI